MPPVQKIRSGSLQQRSDRSRHMSRLPPRVESSRPRQIPRHSSRTKDVLPVARSNSPMLSSLQSPTDVLAGTFGEYQLTGSSLGSGGFGSVLEAIDVETGGSLAIKTMERRTDARDAKIRHEIEVLKWLSDGMGHGRKPIGRSSSEPCLVSAAARHPLLSKTSSMSVNRSKKNKMKKYSLHSHPGRPGDNKKDGGSDSIIYQGHHGLHHAVEGNNAEQDANHTLSQSYRPQRQNFFNLHITAIRDCVVTPERVHIVMAAAKCNLADYIASKRRLCEPEARRLFRQLIQAVCYCHAKAVVHRDLKLENVLISNDGATLELADFGLSKFVDPNNFLCSSVCGTPKYIAPEVILRRRYDGRKSDVWACGVILFAMLNGRLPFHAFKLKTLRSWVAFVEIASKMSKRRYKSLVQAQFVTVDSDAKKNSKTQRSKTSRDDSQKEIEHDGQRERTLVCSVAAEQLISSMLRFSPEDRTDTDEITFHEWMHPDEGTEEYNEDEIITTQLFPDSTVESNKRAQTKQQVMRKSTDKYQDSSHNSKIGESGALLRTRRAEARNAPIWASDSTASACTNCHKKFSIFRRRHHCRCCGLIFCHPCAIKRDLKDLPVHLRGFVPVRCPRDYEAGEDTELDVKFLRICDICIATNPR